jgi:hypothetical protein
MTFPELCAMCLENNDFVREWNRLTGHKLGVTRTPIEIAIDKTCGYDPNEKAMPEFVDFIMEYIWLPVAMQEMKRHGIEP